MKTTNLITVLISMMILSSVMNAANPKDDKKGGKGNAMIETLSKDVTLTENQKARVEPISQALMVNIKEANKIADRKKLVSVKKELFKEYNKSLDVILTNDQKTQRTLKEKERVDALRNKIKTNQDK
ncbi:MAG: hypothetical protein PHT07_23460 [Paludibacter sp.]|nr:hypothetical protein [Paludibacter sp.]